MYWSGLSAAANAAAAYQTGQTGYPVGHTPTGTYTTQRAAGSTYDTSYQTAAAAAATHSTAAGTYPSAAASATYDYGYGRTTQTAAAAAAAAYDSSKTYYAQPSSATAYTGADTHYHSSPDKAAYTNASAYTTTSRQTTPVVTAKTSYTGAYPGAAAATATYNTSPYAVQTTTANKAAASPVYMQQTSQPTTAVAAVKTPGNTWQTFKKPGTMQKPQKPKAPPKPQQLHYCDVCKISCAGPQTYREHLEGQKHKKKEAAAKAGPTPSRHGASLRCELCDVTCTGADAYAAHIRGAKHQKVVKLHQKLGKPIPSTDPVVVGGTTKTSTTTAGATAGAKTTPSGTAAPPSSASTLPAAAPPPADGKKEDLKDDLLDLKEKDVEPVGQEYIEEIKNEEGKVISFNCKLCECRFNDPNAKEMHMKGRRHRLQYKKKVNPELVVEVKPSLRQRKLQEEKLRRQQLREEMWRRREEERLLEEEERWYWEERRRYEEECEYLDWCRRYPRGPPGPPPMMPPGMPRPPFMPGMPPMMPMRRPDSSDDRHVLAKHAEIYPKEEELGAIQKIVSNTEKALKMVSDYLAEVDAPKEQQQQQQQQHIKPKSKKEVKKEEKVEEEDHTKDGDKKDDGPPRMLKGVMRVGILAKGLLLRGDTSVQLVVLCGDKPTRTLLDRVADNLPKQLAIVAAEDKYDIQRVVEEAALVVQNVGGEQRISVNITLTSPIMREQMLHDADSQVTVVKDPPDVLDKQKCLDALAALRHAKWFQARANGLQSCVMVIRILRDLCQRVPTWGPLNSWAMELMCEKVIASAGQHLSPGDALRRVFEALASGLLLPGSPGLLDPCEKDPLDAASPLSAQEREDITASAQHALRLIAFRQIHKVLGMDPIPPPKFQRGGRFTRKRRRDNSTGEGNDSEGGDGKKDKKEDEDSKMDMDKESK